MGFRFRKSVNMGPLRINFSKSGVGWSVGGKNARITHKSTGGTRTTLSIPGTGISYIAESKIKKGNCHNMTTNKKTEIPQNWIAERLGLTEKETELACAAINLFGNQNFTQRDMANAGYVAASQVYTNLYNKNVFNKNDDNSYCINTPYINRIGEAYQLPKKGHSILLHLIFGGMVLWIPAIYYTFSPNHYWHL